MSEARTLEVGDFSGRVGETFTVESDGQQVPLRLDACQALPHSQRDGGGFRLEFVGPDEPQLGQGTFDFASGGESFAIFIVALGPGADGMRYEAIFY